MALAKVINNLVGGKIIITLTANGIIPAAVKAEPKNKEQTFNWALASFWGNEPKTLIKRLSVATAFGMTLSLLFQGEAGAITFTKIADTSGPINIFLFTEAINDSGTVGFSALLDDGSFGIFTGSGGALTTIADTGGLFDVVESFDINNSGTLAFAAVRDDGSIGLFTSSGGAITTIADDSGSFSSFGSFGIPIPTINDSGTVAFDAFLDTGGQSIFTSSGGAITTIADDSGSFSSFFGEPFINNSGTVAFGALRDDGSTGIFTGSGGAITTIADDSSPFNGFGVSAINDSGTLAFTAFTDAGGLSIFTASGGVITTIADDSGSFLGFNNPAINNSNNVAFFAGLDDGSFGIFTGSDPVADKVIASGDTLFGSTVADLSFYNRGLNNSNQISFFARFADGTEGLFRANLDDLEPQPVPEPASMLSLLTVGAWGGVSRQKRS